MSVETPPVAAHELLTPTPIHEPASFDERWAEWQAKGAAQDRAVRRRMAIAAPILIAVAAVLAYALLGR
jgi:hypothetical protein